MFDLKLLILTKFVQVRHMLIQKAEAPEAHNTFIVLVYVEVPRKQLNQDFSTNMP